MFCIERLLPTMFSKRYLFLSSFLRMTFSRTAAWKSSARCTVNFSSSILNGLVT